MDNKRLCLEYLVLNLTEQLQKDDFKTANELLDCFNEDELSAYIAPYKEHDMQIIKDIALHQLWTDLVLHGNSQNLEELMVNFELDEIIVFLDKQTQKIFEEQLDQQELYDSQLFNRINYEYYGG